MAVETEASLLRLISEIHGREGAATNTDLYRSLLSAFLRRVYRTSRGYAMSWQNTAGGALTLSGGEATLPAECIAVTRVEWDGDDNPLERRSVEWLDTYLADWRSQTGEPSYYCVEGRTLYLDSAPPAPVTGKLVVRGRGMPATNDLAIAHLPLTEQFAPAYDVLFRLPVNKDDPMSLTRKAEYQPLAMEGFQGCVAALGGREMEEMRY